MEIQVSFSNISIQPFPSQLLCDMMYDRNMLSKSQTLKLLKDICQSISLHGYNYLYISDSIILKILWGIVILIATGAGIGFIVTNTKAYMEATITTNIESTSENLSVSNKNRNKCSKLQINLLVLL